MYSLKRNHLSSPSFSDLFRYYEYKVDGRIARIAEDYARRVSLSILTAVS